MGTDSLHVAYGGFWWRVLAYIIDTVVLCVGLGILAFPMAMLFMAAGEHRAGLEFSLQLFVFIGTWIYYALMESSGYQATVGKKACSLKVTDLDGERISFARATGRYFAKYISALLLLIGFIMIAFTKRKQGLHDKMAGTLVVRVTAPTGRVPVESAA